jgi:hypothetical protein
MVTALGLLLGSTAGCMADTDRDATYTPPIRRDSGRVAIVENAMPLWRDNASIRISSPPEVMIGSADLAGPAGAHGEGESNNVALRSVLDIRVLPGERIVVADAGLNAGHDLRQCR